MHFPLTRSVSLVVCVWFSCGHSFSQTIVKPPVNPPVKPSVDLSKIEPGLDVAVNWKWWVAPSDKKEWGISLVEAPKPPGTPGAPASAGERPETYEVKKGDVIIKIARKFDMTAAQLQQFNKLKDDRITIGQVLRIPTPAEVVTMAPALPPPPEAKKETATKKKSDRSVRPLEPELFIDPGDETQLELEQVRLQVFLDREMFSPGVIDGKSGAKFQKICEIYQRAHPDVADPVRLKTKAEAMLKEPYTRYTLRADDFKFIRALPKKPVPTQSGKSPKKKTTKSAAAPTKPPPITIDELVAADFLSYETTWEFVAERFHCDEALLRRINPLIKGTPVAGTEFQVPNVIPFEIEKALDAPLQPVADPEKPVTAAVVLLNRLEITREGKLIAVMPLTTARPALRGRGSWIVMDAIAQPRLATKREPREAPKENPTPPEGNVATVKPATVKPETAPPVIDPPLEKEQYLAPGPNNPVGIIWINLAKYGSTDPLPYGLHGTSIPSKMSLQGIGGLRLTNWDIARAARLIPAGTALQWRAK